MFISGIIVSTSCDTALLEVCRGWETVVVDGVAVGVAILDGFPCLADDDGVTLSLFLSTCADVSNPSFHQFSKSFDISSVSANMLLMNASPKKNVYVASDDMTTFSQR